VLSPAEVAEIAAIFPLDVAAGLRYPAAAMGLLNG